MHRRRILAGITGSALALGAGRAAAQSAPRVVHPGAAVRTVEASTTESARQALSAGIFSLATSELAATRAEGVLLKTFAGFEVAEQRAVLQALRVAGLPVPEQPMLEGEQPAMMRELHAADGGFDRLYLRLQLTIHQDLLTLHERLKTAGGREQRVISTLSAVTSDQHLRILQSLQARQA